MAAEDTDTRPTSAGSRGRAAPEDDHDREEGEIADDDNSSHAPPVPAKHPLEHAWTFWFDNPQGKSKQAAWGSSIRPIHTFPTVEDFWGYVFPDSPLLLIRFRHGLGCRCRLFCLVP
jgi:translation initiation factor 4E